MKTEKIFTTSAFKLSLLYMCLFLFSVLLIFSFIYWSMNSFMQRQTEATIAAEIQGLQEQYKILGLPGLVAIIQERSRQKSKGIYLLTDWNTRPLAGNISSWPGQKISDSGWLAFSLYSKQINALARAFTLKEQLHLLVGRNIEDQLQTKSLLLKSMSWAIGATLVLGLVGGVFMSRALLRRLEKINKSISAVRQGNISQRLPLTGSSWQRDELDQLTININDMLEQIEYLISSIRQVGDNIAHDLRTPLGRLRSRLEQYLNESNARQHTEILAQSLTEIDNILHTFNSILQISRAEAGVQRKNFTHLDLKPIIQNMFEFYLPLAEDKNIDLNLKMSPQLPVMGEANLINQALSNILENAIKYTPIQGQIKLTAYKTKNSCCLQVADSGPGIPDQFKDKVLQRFYRLEHSRNQPGNGLGLSLVEAMAKLHQGQLELQDNDPGLIVRLYLPSAKILNPEGIREA